MALIACPECEKEISDRAKECPSCGHPVKIITQTQVLGRGARKCLACNYAGKMKPYLSHGGPMLTTLILLLFFFIPGLIFVLLNRGKFKCPHCGAVANIPI